MKAYLDSCIFIVYAEKEMSNSQIIIEAARCGLFSPVISFHTIYEVMHNLKTRHGKDVASAVFSLVYLLPTSEIVSRERIIAYQKQHYYSIRDKDDLPHIIAYLLSRSDYFITINRRLTQMEMPENVAFSTPKEFVESVQKIKGFNMPY
jgi:predicted nucleic acid-binding protein